MERIDVTQDLRKAYPHTDFDKDYDDWESGYSVGKYICDYLLRTCDIIMSTKHLRKVKILDFVGSSLTDDDLLWTEQNLLINLKWSPQLVQRFLVQQSCVQFRPGEFKILGSLDMVPFASDSSICHRSGGHSTIEKVFELNQPLARKIIKNKNVAVQERNILQFTANIDLFESIIWVDLVNEIWESPVIINTKL